MAFLLNHPILGSLFVGSPYVADSISFTIGRYQPPTLKYRFMSVGSYRRYQITAGTAFPGTTAGACSTQLNIAARRYMARLRQRPVNISTSRGASVDHCFPVDLRRRVRRR
jgi:hypothetical protein